MYKVHIDHKEVCHCSSATADIFHFCLVPASLLEFTEINDYDDIVATAEAELGGVLFLPGITNKNYP